MDSRPSELIQSLRVALQEVEQTLFSPEDAFTLAEIKRLILTRIAHLESRDAMRIADGQPADRRTLEQFIERAIEATHSEKLD
jgi:hypothetical protein